MNTENLNLIIENYINRFDKLNAGEKYKWTALQHFQNRWDIDAEDFGAMFKDAVSETYNLISNRFVQPTIGIIEMAKHDPERVRLMFRQLYMEDNGDLEARQDRVDAFITESEALLAQYAPGKWKFRQDTRTVISYLALRHPDENYIFKSTAARTFAQYIGYTNDIGTGSDFKLLSYYQMCDQIVEAIKNNDTLLVLNETRMDESTWPDKSHHLLASDIIFCAPGYNLFDDLTPIIKSKKGLAEKAKADKKDNLEAKIHQIKTDLYEIKDEIEDHGHIHLADISVIHSKFGKGKVVSHTNNMITVLFKDGEKRLGLPDAFINKSTLAEPAYIQNYFETIADLLNEEAILNRKLMIAEAELNAI